MKQFVLGFLVATVIFAGGFFIFNNKANDTPARQSDLSTDNKANAKLDEPNKPEGAVLCDMKKNSCDPYERTENSGNLKVSITGFGKPMEGVEVDVGNEPGAQKYYLRETDDQGIAQFDGLPPGSYKIYFNLNDFPKGYDASQLIDVKITKGQTTEKIIELKKK